MSLINPQKNFFLLAALVLLVLLIIFFSTSYNSLVKKDEAVSKYWNNLQSDYQRRIDLIPNLVSVVRGSTDYERETLLKLMENRAHAAKINFNGDVTAENYHTSEKAQGDVANSSNKVIAVIEKYPDLKATTNFLRLQDQLTGTERRIKFSRKDFNEAVMGYNTSVRSFPSSITAGLFGFKIKEGFTADTGTDKAPEINFTK
jgi:LemA protein